MTAQTELAQAGAAAVTAVLRAKIAAQVRVVVRDGWLILEGSVEFPEERARAEVAARRLCGLRGVDNRLELIERPGTAAPAVTKLPPVRIHKLSPSPVQGGRGHQKWVLEFEPGRPRVHDFLMGWIGSDDPFVSLDPLRFGTCHAAVAFCERHGWTYVIVPPPPRFLILKSYADNFRAASPPKRP